jgi:predicted ATP-dependent endonuclease of OLD family
MRILTYEYRDVDEARWQFSKARFGKINLLVGDTSTGKTRLLNTLFNLGRFATSKEFRWGYWDLVFKQDEATYRWLLETRAPEAGNCVIQDYIWRLEGEKEISIVRRDKDSFIFDGREMPKLAKDQSSISLLEDEDLIEPLHKGFASVMRRRFSYDALSKAATFHIIPLQLLEEIKKNKDTQKIFASGMSLSANLFLLSEYFPSYFLSICDCYRSVFPFITEIAVLDLSDVRKSLAVPARVPVFCIKERNVDKWITLEGLSSGMQKVLLILTDICLIPEGGIYLIDEYENSLGINAIEFLPTFLLELEKDVQFFITSHHPYIINQIPVSSWHVFHRKGSEVTIKFGEELVDRFGKSKQKAFIQLINDPFYTEGVE